MLAVEVTQYEQHEEPGGMLVGLSPRKVTMYIIRVEMPSQKVDYLLKKRYSDFDALHKDLLEKLPKIASFKFPNKSVFNTHSEFTKERRREGFDAFLKQLVKEQPMPAEVEEFLELKEHFGGNHPFHSSSGGGIGSRKSATANYNNAPQIAPLAGDSYNNSNSSKLRGGPFSSSSPSSSSSSSSSSSASSSSSSSYNTSTITGNDDDTAGSNGNYNNSLSSSVPTILLQSYGLTVITYFALVAVEVIDVDTSSSRSMFITILAIGSAISFLRILLSRRASGGSGGGAGGGNGKRTRRQEEKRR